MNSRFSFVIFSFTVSIAFEVLWIILYQSTEETGIVHRMAIALGGNFLGGGYIQFFTYAAFFWGMGEIFSSLKNLRYQKTAFPLSARYNLLFENQNENYTFRPHDIESLKGNAKQLIRKEKEQSVTPLILLDLVRKVCLKFRSNDSIAEVLEIVTTQSRINLTKEESKQSVTRYLAWAIPSIGFIGTVLGISQALGVADSNDMQLITGTLGIAFDTTLVALLLSIVMMWYLHELQEKTEQLHSEVEEYVIENLVNRLEVKY